MLSVIVLALLSLLLPFVNGNTALPDVTCTVNSLKQTQTVTSPVAINTSPTAPFEDVKLSAINQTAWESYSFEGVSDDGSSGLSIRFFRNPSLAAQDYGVVWVEINAVWQNGTQWSAVLWQNQSVVVACDVGDDVGTSGYWNDVDDITKFSFRVPRTLASASLNLFGDGVEGSCQMTSIAPPTTVNATGLSNPHGSVELAPLTYWIEPIPIAKMNATIQFSGTKFDLQGFGGHWRNWAPYNWDSLATCWYRVRAVAGPYTIIYWTFTSALDGQTYTSGILGQNGTNIFATRNGTPVSGSSSAIFWLSYSGTVHGSYEDNSTGITVQFVEGSREWRFFVTHKNVLSESPHGTAEAYTSFVNTVVGGDIAGPQFEGVATSDQAVIANPISI